MNTLLAVAAGGAIGAMSRYGVGIMAVRYIGHGFPWGTLIVNILGSFLMGLVIRFLASHLGETMELRAFLTTGVLGGFTTFSAFSLDFATLVERGDHGAAFAYVALSVLVSLLAVFVGLYAGRVVWP